MHGSPPAGAIIIHSLGPEEHPDFSGPGFLAAKKAMLMSPEDESKDPVGPGEPIPHPDGMCDALMEIASQLREASRKHLGQAERIEELCAQMMGENPEKSKDDEAHGEAKELE